MSKKRLSPGDLVLGLDSAGSGPNKASLTMRYGFIVAVTTDERESHHGCEERLLVLWATPISTLSLECDCGVILPIDLGM